MVHPDIAFKKNSPMPLIAYERSSGRRVNILNYKEPKKHLEKGDLFCENCGAELLIKHGNIKIQHFAHVSACTSDFERHPESVEHMIAKHLISKHIKEEWSEYSDCEIQLELPIASLKRIMDIAMVFKTGWIVAHEIQLSSITTKDLEKRTNDYLDEGIDVIWWLGKDADTPGNRGWCTQKYGGCYLLDYKQLRAQASVFRSS